MHLSVGLLSGHLQPDQEGRPGPRWRPIRPDIVRSEVQNSPGPVAKSMSQVQDHGGSGGGLEFTWTSCQEQARDGCH